MSVDDDVDAQRDFSDAKILTKFDDRNREVEDENIEDDTEP